MTTQFYLVSDQAIPNVTPALYLNPSCVVLLTTPVMQLKAVFLQTVLTRHGIATEIVTILDENDFPSMRRQLVTLLDTYPNAILNATGGKKTMSLVAYEIFVARKLEVFYVETNSQLRWLYPEDRPDQMIPDLLGVQDYLYVYGWQMLSGEREIGEHNKGMAQAFLDKPKEWIDCLARLRYLNDTKTQAGLLRLDLIYSSKLTPPARAQTLARLEQLHSVFNFTEKQDDEFFLTAIQGNYLRGAWFEREVFGSLLKEKRDLGIFDLIQNVKIGSLVKPEVENEFDILFTKGNALYIIECKAMTEDKLSQQLVDFIYKMDSLRKIGGTAGRAFIVSLIDLPYGSRLRKRMESVGIRLVAPYSRKALFDAISR